jgi:prophage regulatory protein
MPPTSDLFLDLPAVKEITSLSRSTIYAKISDGTFPAPAKIGAASRWSLREVERWVASKLDERRNALRAA